MDISNWLQAALGFAPIVVFGGLLFLMMRRARNGPVGMPDKYDQLKKIADLKDRGVLTEREFEVEKRKILATDEGNRFLPKS